MMYKLILALIFLVFSCTPFAVNPIQTELIVPALNPDIIIPSDDISGLSITDNMLRPRNIIDFDSFNAIPVDPYFFKPEVYTLTQYATKGISNSMPPSRIDVVKLTSLKDELALIYNYDNSNYSRIDINRAQQNSLPVVLNWSLAYDGDDTSIFTATSPKQGQILLGGGYRPTSYTSRILLTAANYSGGVFGGRYPVELGLSSNAVIVDIDTAFTSSTSSKDYAMAVYEKGTTYHTGILFRTYSGSVSYKTFTKDYMIDGYYHMRGGKFISSTKYGFAFVGSSSSATDIYLFNSTSGSFNTKAVKAIKTSTGKNIMITSTAASDIDSDGQDELLIAGGYDTYNNFTRYSDIVQIYKYDSGNWVLLAEALNSTGGSSWALAVDADDVDSDGKREIIVFSWAVNGSGSYGITKGVVTIYDYTATPTSKILHVSSADFNAAGATSSYCYNPRRARWGDFDGDGKKEIAVEFTIKPNVVVERRLAILDLVKDNLGPTINITKPVNSAINATGSIDVEFISTDLAGINADYVKMRIIGAAYDSGYKTGTITQITIGKSLKSNYTFLVSNLTPGNYTLITYSGDGAGNTNTMNKTLTVANKFVLGDLNVSIIPWSNLSNTSNGTIIEPEVTIESNVTEIEQEDVIEPTYENVSNGTETPPMNETGVSNETSSNPGGVPSEGNGTAGSTQTGITNGTTETNASSTLDKLILELEIKIDVAKKQGADTSEAESLLANATTARQAGELMDAALAAQKGITLVSLQIEGANAKPPATGTDYIPYIIAASVIIALGGAYMLFAKKPAT